MEPQYVSIGGEKVRVPDGTTAEALFEQYAQYLKETGEEHQEPALESDTSKPQYQPLGKVEEDIDPETLKDNRDWLAASYAVYQLVERKPFEGSPEELSEWGREQMAYFNYNLVSTGVNTHRVMDADQRTKEAFLYMMDTFDNTKMSWKGAGNAAEAMVTDPSNYVGLSSLGLGSVFRYGAQQAAKQTFRRQLVNSAARAGTIAGIEGGLVSYADDRMRQAIEIDAGRLDGPDTARSLKAAGVGAAAGAVLGTGLDAAATSLGRRFGREASKEAPGAATSRPGEAQGEPQEVTPQPGSQEPTATPAQEVPGEPRAGQDTTAQPGSRQQPGESSQGESSDGATRKPGSPSPAQEAQKLRATVASFPTREVAGFTIPDKPGFIRQHTTNAEVREFASVMADQLDNLPPHITEDSLDAFLREHVSPTEYSEFQTSVQLASNKLTHELQDVLGRIRSADDEALPQLQREKDFLADAQGAMEHLDSILRGNAGRDLQKRKIGETDLNGLSWRRIENVLQEEHGLSGAQLQDAVADVFSRQYVQLMNARKYREELGKLDKQIEDALVGGDMQKVMQLAVDKSKITGRLSADTTRGVSIWEKLTEAAISNVFSMKTLAVNLIPSAIKGLAIPAVRGTARGWGDRATRAEAAAAYGAMKTTFRAALRSGLAAWRYEQALMSHDPNRFLESHLALGGGKISGRVAPHIRVFLRGINATDEFLTRIFYNSEVAARAAYVAAEKGAAFGHSGKALDDFIRKETGRSLDNAYRVDKVEVLIDPILRKGQNLGLRGQKLEEYIRKEVARDPQSLVRASDKEAMDAVREILYKRGFSGTNFISSAAKNSEDVLNKYPAAKLIMGQLFFRTPLRVIEEAMRITPGINWITPGYLKDLRGKNGEARRLRAQGEAMVSFALLAHSLTLWAEGGGRGDGGDKSWQQTRFRTDSHLPDNYTFTDSDGDSFNFRYFDPLATPYKVMFGIYERLDKLKLREAQGEFIAQSELAKYKDAVLMVAAATLSAVRDANLLTGLNNTTEVLEMLADGDDRPGAVVKLLGDKVRLLTPSTLHKTSSAFSDGMRSPATLEQMVDQQLLRPWGLDLGIKTPYSYDWLGRRRTLADAGSLFNIVSLSTSEERARGRSADELKIDELAAGLIDRVNFVPQYPYRAKETGNLDLRTVLTHDGKETLYDRWNKYYAEQVPKATVRAILESAAPEGTYKFKGAKAQQLQEILQTARESAFARLQAEERSVIQSSLRDQIYKAQTEAGLWDADRKGVRPKVPESPWSN